VIHGALAPRCPESAVAAVLFDLDGTLVDTVHDIAFCVNAMLHSLGLPERSAEEVQDWVGHGAEALVRRALATSRQGIEDEELAEHGLGLFLDLYARHVSDSSRAYPDAVATLEALRDAGLRLACVTNKPTRHSEQLLCDLGLRGLFELLVCGDTLPRRKPDPLPLLHAASCLGAEPETTVFVGDSVNDIRAARAAGMCVVCVSYGYNHGEDIRPAGPDAVIDSLGELPSLLAAPPTGQAVRGGGSGD
jgi:phosphoglycolate phosphatase